MCSPGFHFRNNQRKGDFLFSSKVIWAQWIGLVVESCCNRESSPPSEPRHNIGLFGTSNDSRTKCNPDGVRCLLASKSEGRGNIDLVCDSWDFRHFPFFLTWYYSTKELEVFFPRLRVLGLKNLRKIKERMNARRRGPKVTTWKENQICQSQATFSNCLQCF